MSTNQKVRERLNRIIRDRGYAYQEVSEAIGRNSSYIQQFIKRGVPQTLKESDRRALSAFLDVADWELGGPRPSENGEARVDTAKADKRGITLVPYYALGASAGAGSLVDEEIPEKYLPFRREWIRDVTSATIDQLAVIEVRGDSMHPTLNDGDQILIELSDAPELRDGIFVFRQNGTLQVKRVTIQPGAKTISIKSDNPLYDSWDDISPSQLDVVGRVIWVGRKV